MKTPYQNTHEAVQVVNEIARDANWKVAKCEFVTTGIVLLKIISPLNPSRRAVMVMTGCGDWGEENEVCVFVTKEGAVPPMRWIEMVEVIDHWYHNGEMPPGIEVTNKV